MAENVIEFTDNCDEEERRPANLAASASEKKNFFKLYPNPNAGQILLEYNIEAGDQAEMRLYDMSGRRSEPIRSARMKKG